MKQAILFTLVLAVFLSAARSQQVNVNSFHHAIRWVNEINLPRYIAEREVQDSILSYASVLLKDLFKAQAINMPGSISVQYIEVMGKVKPVVLPESGDAETIQVNIVSFVSRATTGFGVNWSMEMAAKKAGQVVYQKKRTHELEYYSPTGYMSGISWYTPEEYIGIYRMLLTELMTDSSLPEKVVIGSPEQKEKYVKSFLPDAERLVMHGRGNFMEGGNFGVALSRGADTLMQVRYRDGVETVSSNPFSGIGANILSGITGVDFTHNVKVKISKKGRLNYSDGRSLDLELKWLETVNMSSMGRGSELVGSSPVIGEAFENGKTVASFAYYNRLIALPRNQFEMHPQVAHMINAVIGEDSLYAELDPTDNIVRVMENKQSVVAVILENVTPGSSSFSGSRLTKNKFTMLPSGKKGLDESYYFYHKPGLEKERLQRYLDAVMLLLFCKGNGM